MSHPFPGLLAQMDGRNLEDMANRGVNALEGAANEVVEWTNLAYFAAEVAIVVAGAIFFLCFLWWIRVLFTETIKQGNLGVRKRLGRVVAILQPGLYFMNPFTTKIENIFPGIRPLEIKREPLTTKDKVSITLTAQVQFRLQEGQDNLIKALYGVQNRDAILAAMIKAQLRAIGAQRDLEDCYGHQDEIADELRKRIGAKFGEYGCDLVDVMITEIDPADEVRRAMDAQRVAELSVKTAEEAGKAQMKEARATADALKLGAETRGQGAAQERFEATQGLVRSILLLAGKECTAETKPPELAKLMGQLNLGGQGSAALLLAIQNQEQLAAIARNPKGIAIVANSDAGGVAEEARRLIPSLFAQEGNNGVGKDGGDSGMSREDMQGVLNESFSRLRGEARTAVSEGLTNVLGKVADGLEQAENLEGTGIVGKAVAKAVRGAAASLSETLRNAAG